MTASTRNRRLPPAPVDPGLLAEAGQGLDAAVALRRRIHARPETGLDLPATQEMILDELDGLGLSPSTGSGDHLRRRRPGGGAAGPDHAAPCRHGCPGDARGHRAGVRLDRGRQDARLRPRRPRGHAGGRRPGAGRAAAGPAGPGGLDVPARRGRLWRRPHHARGRPAGGARARRPGLRHPHHSHDPVRCGGLPGRCPAGVVRRVPDRGHGRGAGTPPCRTTPAIRCRWPVRS